MWSLFIGYSTDFSSLKGYRSKFIQT